ncbi:MAG: hypothetical protein DHS20C17_32820 [Cyclobacteriaceae bacterium]|nr:MAG: hypothetical protein DHS20C17_32820 [Cyclobacteriaceae bacterium]
MDSALNPNRLRIQSVDVLRGIVMIIMALDHVRLFMGATSFSPVDPTQTTVALFFTRWITHFCAPVFVFLAGTSAFLYARNTNCDLNTLRNFLLTRGLWIIFVEIFLLNLAAQFIPYQFLVLQVLWIIGWSMIILAGLIYLPKSVILLIALALVFGHNLLDYLFPEENGWFFSFLHKQQLFPSSTLPIYIHYPLLPWPGLMALGYLFGRLLVRPTPNRNAQIWFIGLICVALFLILRGINFYGDPAPWENQPRGLLFTVLSYLNTTKYPPSLLFLLMTIGPALLVIPWLEKWQGRKVKIISIFGKVPFFFYLLHFLIIHIIATLWSQLSFGTTEWWLGAPSGYPEGYELNLWLIYGIWVMVMILCYPLCYWYSNYKNAHKEQWWLSYL